MWVQQGKTRQLYTCEHQPNIDTNVATMVILSDNEILKPSNTPDERCWYGKDGARLPLASCQAKSRDVGCSKRRQIPTCDRVPLKTIPTTKRAWFKTCHKCVTQTKHYCWFSLMAAGAEKARRIFRRSGICKTYLCCRLSLNRFLNTWCVSQTTNNTCFLPPEVASLVLKQAGENRARTLQLWFEAFSWKLHAK